MRKYDAYKDSGVKWIGEIPQGWNTCRIKNMARGKDCLFIDGDWIESKVITQDGIVYTTTGNIGPGYFKYQSLGHISEETFCDLNCTEVKPGDLVISRLNEPIGRACIFPKLGYKMITAVDNVIFRPDESLYDKKFLMYEMNSAKYTTQANLIARGSTMHRISRSMLGTMSLAFPPLSEQRAIVAWLDRKTTEIDRLIAAREKRVHLLEELKASIISHAVTHGIDPNAKMKPSGVDWIGNIPEGWETERLRFVCSFRNGYTPSKNNKDFWEGGTIPWFRMDDIRDKGRKLSEAKQYVTEEAIKGQGLFEAGSFILATSATIGEHAMLMVDALSNQRFVNLKIQKPSIVSKEYFFYYLYVVDDYCKSSTTQATFSSVNMEDMRNCTICIPPMEEQIGICNYLDNKLVAINHTQVTQRREISLLREYKQSLITEVVTGKRKVV